MTAVTADIVRYRPEFARDFARLNRAWLEQYFTIEPRDEEYLGDPEGRILAPGGEIFFAVQGGAVVGTSAAIAQGDGQFELAKLCVTPALRLYEALGFEHRPFPGPPPYADADVYMELVFADRS